jgi:CRISPR system Cascade subunit CasB
MSTTTTPPTTRLQAATDFVRRLDRLDNGPLAELRRSLGFPPGTYHRAFPAIEPFVRHREGWPRAAHYLLAGLWASVNTASVRATAHAAPPEAMDDDAAANASVSVEEVPIVPGSSPANAQRNLGHAIGQLYLARERSPSVEQRFIALLDADDEQLPDRLRQMVRLLDGDGIAITWPRLLVDLLDWQADDRPVQQRWARAFYRAIP